MVLQRLTHHVQGLRHAFGVLALGQRAQRGSQQVRCFQPHHQAIAPFAAVIARREVRDKRCAVEVDREVEIAFATRRDAGNLLHGLHAAQDLRIVQQPVGVGLDVDAGIGKVAMVTDQPWQQRNLLSRARLANGKADAQPVLVQLHEDVPDRGQPLAGRFQAGRVQILPERVGHDTHRLHRVAPLLEGSCQPVALPLGFGQH